MKKKGLVESDGESHVSVFRNVRDGRGIRRGVSTCNHDLVRGGAAAGGTTEALAARLREAREPAATLVRSRGESCRGARPCLTARARDRERL